MGCAPVTQRRGRANVVGIRGTQNLNKSPGTSILKPRLSAVGTSPKPNVSATNIAVQPPLSKSPQFLAVPMNTSSVVMANPNSGMAARRNVKFQDEVQSASLVSFSDKPANQIPTVEMVQSVSPVNATIMSLANRRPTMLPPEPVFSQSKQPFRPVSRVSVSQSHTPLSNTIIRPQMSPQPISIPLIIPSAIPPPVSSPNHQRMTQTKLPPMMSIPPRVPSIDIPVPTTVSIRPTSAISEGYNLLLSLTSSMHNETIEKIVPKSFSFPKT